MPKPLEGFSTGRNNPLKVVGEAADHYRRLDAAIAGEDIPCQMDPEMWWSRDPVEILMAKRLCRECPAVRECLLYALVGNEAEGVWGAADPHERMAMQRDLSNLRRAAARRERRAAEREEKEAA